MSLLQPHARRTAYVVMGPHRSGTSAMARILSLAGAGLPRDLVAPHPKDNPTGFWESRSVIQLNDAILRDWGGSWSDPVAATEAVSEASAERGRWVLRRMFPGSGPVVLKDPRIAFTAPFWRSTLRQAGFAPFFIVMYRPASEVVASSGTSYGLSDEDGLRLWSRYAKAALSACEPEAHAVVSYAAVLDNPRAVLERIGVSEPSAGWGEFAERAGAFLSPELHRQRRSEAVTVISDEMREFEQAFEALADMPPVVSPADPASDPELSERPSRVRWLLITGAPRSGTTLLRALVDEHPDAVVLQEFGLTRLVRGLNALVGRPKPIHPSWVSFAGRDTPLGAAAAFYAERDDAGGAGSPGDLGAVGLDALAQGALSALADRTPQVIGDKMPLRGEWEDIEYLQHQLPELMVLLTVRNPRAVIHSSMIRRARQALGGDLWPIRTVQEAAEEWWLAWRRAADLVKRFGPAIHVLKYEDLCSRPDETMDDVRRGLGLGPHRRITPVRGLPAHIDALSAEEADVIDNLLGEVVRVWDDETDALRLLERFADLPRPYVPGRRVMASAAEADDILGDGFSWQEDWGRWTDGERATLRIRHGSSSGSGLLELQIARAFVPEGGACDVVVRAGSSAPQLFGLGSGPARIALLCPLSGGPLAGVLDVELLVLNPKGALDPPADERRLGLGLESVSLRLVT